MITSRRDYILRIIDEVARMLARVIFKRRSGTGEEALELVVEACERLFSLERDQLFQFTPRQHFAMLTENEPPQIARDKVLLYAGLNAEAGRVYEQQGNAPLARATRMNALRFALRARECASDAPLPEFAPKVEELLAALGPEPLDPDVIALLGGRGPGPA